MFSNRYVKTIILSRVALHLGIWIRNFAVLLYVTELTNNDPLYVSLISVVEYAPIFLFALIGGTFADRWRPKRTMVASDFLSALSVMIVLVALSYGGWYALLLGTLVSASLSQFSQPSAMKLYKEHVPSEQLQSVMALSQTLAAIFMVIGPIIGSYVFLQFGIQVALFLTFVLFAGSALILSFLPKDVIEIKDTQNQSFVTELKAGIRYLWNSRSLRTLSATFSVTGLAAGLVQPMLFFVVIERLGQDKSFLQWLLMSNGAAMLVGGIVIMSVAKKYKPEILLTAGLIISAVVTFCIGASTNIMLTIILSIINGFFYPCVQIGIQTMLIRNTEAAYIGRVSGAITPFFMGMMVIGMGTSGFLKEVISIVGVYSLSGTLILIGVLLFLPLIWGHRKQADKVSFNS